MLPEDSEFEDNNQDPISSPPSPASTSRTSVQPSTPQPTTTTSKPRQNKYACDFEGCTKSYSRPVRLQEHKRSHTNDRPFACPQQGCDKTFLRESHLKHHIKAKHDDVRDYICDWPDCDKGFHTAQRLKQHKKTHQVTKPEYLCIGYPPCNQSFRKQDTLDRHIQLVHLHEKPFVCDQLDRFTDLPCGARFKTSTHLIAHKDREHSGNRFWCKICSPHMADIDPTVNLDAFTTAVGFPTYIEMQQHIKAVHPPTCSQCQHICASNRDLKAHMEIQHGDIEDRRNYICDYPDCGRGFTKKGNLVVHQRSVHAKQKQFICGETDIKSSKRVPEWDGRGACGRAFSAKANLEEHVRTQHLHLPGYVRPAKREKQEEDDSYTHFADLSPEDHNTVLARLTGVGYEHGRDIACVDETCPHRFVKPFDLEVHLEIVHGYTKMEAIEMVVEREHEREALTGGKFWLGGLQPDYNDQRLAHQLGLALHPQDFHTE
jgi:general transcription factor IIIA